MPTSRTQTLVHCFVSRPASGSQDVTDRFLYSAFLFHLSTLFNMSHWHMYIHRSTSKCFLLAFTHIYTPSDASGEARASVSCPRITLAWKDAAKDQVTNLTVSRYPALLTVPQSLTKKKKKILIGWSFKADHNQKQASQVKRSSRLCKSSINARISKVHK